MLETEKLLTQGETFHVSMDVLLKDELTLNEVKEAHGCGANAVQGKKQEIYEGALIKESLMDDRIIDLLSIHKIELWNAGGRPKYWTVLFYIVFQNKILKYQIGNEAEKALVCAECRKQGILDEQMNWAE